MLPNSTKEDLTLLDIILKNIQHIINAISYSIIFYFLLFNNTRQKERVVYTFVSTLLYSLIYFKLQPHSFVDVLLITFIVKELYSGNVLDKIGILGVSLCLVAVQGYWFVFKVPLNIFDIVKIESISAYSYSVYLLALFFLITFFVTLLYVINRLFNFKRFVLLSFVLLLSFLFQEREDWNPLRNYYKTGYFTVNIVETLTKFQYFWDRSDRSEGFYLNKDFEITSKRNINILILESLFFENDKTENGWSVVQSPSFAGESARAEFEILCGVQSFSKPMIEFNFIRSEKPCLPKILNRFRYKTIVTNTGKPWVYSARKAYNYLGFKYQEWIVDNKELNDRPGGYIYDGELLKYNIKKILNKEEGPYLNYIISSYGHYPYKRNYKKRPNVIKNENKQLEDVLNIQHYRLLEVKSWLAKINDKDPTAINIICGDHLPFIKNYDYGESNKKTYCYSNLSGEIKRIYNLTPKVLKELGCQNCIMKNGLEEEYSRLLH